MKFSMSNPPQIGSKVRLASDNSKNPELYTIIDNDEYFMVELLVIESSSGGRRSCFGSEVEMVLEYVVTDAILDELFDSKPVSTEDGEAWAYQDGWNAAVEKAKLTLREFITKKEDS